MNRSALLVVGWAGLLAAWTAVLWIWSGDPVQVGCFGFAAGMVALAGAGMARSRTRRPRALTDLSLGTMTLAVGLAAAIYGAVFGPFLAYVGAGVMALGAGRLAFESRAMGHRRGERER